METIHIYHRLRSLFKSEHDLIKSIKKLNEIFTVGRDQLDKYVDDETLIAAYGCYYMTTNIPKFKFVIEQLPVDVRTLIPRGQFIDIGTGTGTYLWAYLMTFGKSQVSLVGIDSSKAMLKFAEFVREEFFSDCSVELSSRLCFDQTSLNRPTLLFGNSLNEIGVNGALKIVRDCNPAVIILIEPGTKESFSTILDLRTKIIEGGYQIVYPCRSNLNCQMKSDDWCHQVLRTSHGQELERISQMASLDRKSMPLISNVYVKKELFSFSHDSAGAPHFKGRLIRIYEETKFSYLCQVCVNNQIEKVELLKKYMDKNLVKDFRRISIGVELEFERLKELADGTVRAKLE